MGGDALNPSGIFSLCLGLFLGVGLAAGAGLAAETPSESVQPYLDNVLEHLPEQAPYDGSYIESVKKQLAEEEGPAEEPESYIDLIRESAPEEFRRTEEESYIQKLKSRLQPQVERESAIQAVQEGRSELAPKKNGGIRNAVGLRLGAASLAQSITAQGSNAARAFQEIYKESWVPDLTLFFEFQPFRDEWLGAVGLVVSSGVAVYRGTGLFQYTLLNPVTGQAFASESRTAFTFYTIPLFVGANYRFSLARILRPYVQAGPSAFGYVETRSDNTSTLYGVSWGGIVSGGVNLLLDWISPGSAWSLYELASVKHYYLTVDYSQVITLSGPVRFSSSEISVGFTYEY